MPNSKLLQQRPCILIADNDPISQRLFRAIYGRSDCDIESCDSAELVLQTVKTKRIDLLITEVMLPDDNGFELRKKARLFNAELPIIFVSAVVDSASKKLLENIANDPNTFFLRKPVFKAQLLELTERVISAARERNTHQHYFDQLQSDLSLASKMQKLMLPDWINLKEDRLMMVANYMPHSHLSGDYFDLTTLPDGRYFFVIGDISGHGIRAALHMSVVQSLTNFIIRNCSPENIICDYLNELNRQICVDFDSVFYLTALAAVIDPVRHKIQYLSAGHPGFFSFDQAVGRLNYLGESSDNNIPVGWLPDHVYAPKDLCECDFDDDTMFFALTDGMLEASNADNQMIGITGLCEIPFERSDCMLLPFILCEKMRERGYTVVQDDILVLALGKPFAAPGKIESLLRAIPQSMSMAAQASTEAATLVNKVYNDSMFAYKIELATGEFFNNIIVHGFDNAQKMTPQILFDVEIFADRVEVTFTDQAKEWKYVPSRRNFSEEIEDDFYILAQAGRGMRIIEDLVSSIERTRIASLNITKFIFRLEDRHKEAEA